MKNTAAHHRHEAMRKLSSSAWYRAPRRTQLLTALTRRFLHCRPRRYEMSRGKKIAKAERRRRRERQDAEVARAAQKLTDDIHELTCSNGAARATRNFTEAHLEDLDVDLDHAAAVSDLWSRNAP